MVTRQSLRSPVGAILAQQTSDWLAVYDSTYHIRGRGRDQRGVRSLSREHVPLGMSASQSPVTATRDTVFRPYSPTHYPFHGGPLIPSQHRPPHDPLSCKVGCCRQLSTAGCTEPWHKYFLLDSILNVWFQQRRRRRRFTTWHYNKWWWNTMGRGHLNVSNNSSMV